MLFSRLSLFVLILITLLSAGCAASPEAIIELDSAPPVSVSKNGVAVTVDYWQVTDKAIGDTFSLPAALQPGNDLLVLHFVIKNGHSLEVFGGYMPQSVCAQGGAAEGVCISILDESDEMLMLVASGRDIDSSTHALSEGSWDTDAAENYPGFLLDPGEEDDDYFAYAVPEGILKIVIKIATSFGD
jgi:hypothetical protein